MMMWLLVLVAYAAPADAVNWDGPWKVGMSETLPEHYSSEAECRAEGVAMIGQIHQQMQVPIRAKCVEVDATLPKGAVR